MQISQSGRLQYSKIMSPGSMLPMKILFFMAMASSVWFLWQLKVAIDLQRKIENLPFLVCDCRYSDQSFTEIFLEKKNT